MRVQLLLAGLALVACSPAESTPASTAAHNGVRQPVDPSPIAPGRRPYELASATTYGRLAGAVTFSGPTPADTVTHVVTDVDVCGATLVDVSVRARGPRLAGAVVWISGVPAGKHLPFTKRFDVMTQGCRLNPRVQAAVIGGTVNVRSADATTHRTTFARNGDTVATVSETEDGQIVPNEAILAKAGLVEIRCALHPWTHGWIAVFDHPYFAMSNDDGAFTIDSVPPGRYRVTVWHERFGTVDDSVTIGADVTTTLNLAFRPPAHRSP